WGFVSWEKQPGGIDRNNPDPAKQKRPTLGMPILLGMAPADTNRWDGEIYNSRDGRTYTAHLSLESDNTLRVGGCVRGFVGGARPGPRPGTPPAPPPPAANQRSPRAAFAQPVPSPAPQPPQELCASVGQPAGPEPRREPPPRGRKPEMR